MSADRLPPLPRDEWTDAQRRAAEAIISGPRGALYGPFVPLLRSPELMDCAQRMGEYLRYRAASARGFGARHPAGIARDGISRSSGRSMRRSRSQAGIDPASSMRLPADAGRRACRTTRRSSTTSRRDQRHSRVSDATFERARARFGEQGVVDLIGLNGYYTLLAMVMNAARTPAPASSAAPLVPLLPSASGKRP